MPKVGGPATVPPDHLCAIRGQVFSAANGEPLRQANLTLQRTDPGSDYPSLPATYGTATDASGKFAIARH